MPWSTPEAARLLASGSPELSLSAAQLAPNLCQWRAKRTEPERSDRGYDLFDALGAEARQVIGFLGEASGNEYRIRIIEHCVDGPTPPRPSTARNFHGKPSRRDSSSSVYSLHSPIFGIRYRNCDIRREYWCRAQSLLNATAAIDKRSESEG